MFKSVFWASPLVAANVEDGLELLQHHAVKTVGQFVPVQIGTDKRCTEQAIAMFHPDCDSLGFGQDICQTNTVNNKGCKSKCEKDAGCSFYTFWNKQNSMKSRRSQCMLFGPECKPRKVKGGDAILVQVRETTTTTTTTEEVPVDPVPTTPAPTTGGGGNPFNPFAPHVPVDPVPTEAPVKEVPGAGECDPAADQFCEWRHANDDNTCDEEGCGNRAEFRKKFAELPPIDAPINAEPDAIIAEEGGVPPPTKQFHNLHFKKVTQNDLGGAGIRYSDVTVLEVNGEDRVVDCIVTAPNGYEGFRPERNGLGIGDKIGVINIMHSTSVDLTYSFVFQDNDQPATLGEFFFSVFDMDTGKGYKKGGQRVRSIEKLTISGYEEYYLIPMEKGGEIAVTNHGAGADFEGTTWGRARDNPNDPLVLDELQAARSVSFKFAPGKSTFSLTYSLGKAVRGGRNFMFSGMTNLYFCKAPKVNLNFNTSTVARNNLGNKGPEEGVPEGILFTNIAQIGDQSLDLEVNALEEYWPRNVERNGLLGDFAQINLATPSQQGDTGTCEFKFKLLKGGSDEPYEAEWLYFSMFDLDQAKSNKKWNPKWQESLTVSGFASQYISDGSEIKVEQLDKRTYRYNSSKKGTGKDNPKDPLKLDAVMLARTVTFVYRAVSEWTARFAIGLPMAIDGRNFLFAGKSSTVSCDQNTYGDVINVQNHITPPPGR